MSILYHSLRRLRRTPVQTIFFFLLLSFSNQRIRLLQPNFSVCCFVHRLLDFYLHLFVLSLPEMGLRTLLSPGKLYQDNRA